jgi:hypothetical protein
VEGAAADGPVERVLERPGDTERVLGDGEQDRVGAFAGFPEPLRGVRRMGLQIRVEVRQSPHRLVDRHSNAARAAACAAARRAALLSERRRRLPEIARITYEPSLSIFVPARERTYQPAP